MALQRRYFAVVFPTPSLPTPRERPAHRAIRPDSGQGLIKWHKAIAEIVLRPAHPPERMNLRIRGSSTCGICTAPVLIT